MKMEASIDPTMISSCKLEPPDEDVNVKLSLDYSTHTSTTDSISEDGITVKTELSENAIGLPCSTAILENLVKTGMLSETYCPSSGARMKLEEKDAISVDGVTMKTEPSENTIDVYPSTAISENLVKSEMLSETYCPSSGARMKFEEKIKVENVSTKLDSRCTDDISVKLECEDIKVENLSTPDSQFADGISVKLELEDIKVENLSKSHEPCTDVGVDPDDTDTKPDKNCSMPLPVLTSSQQRCHVDGGDQRNKMDCERSVPSSGSESKLMNGRMENGQDNMVDDDCDTTLEGDNEEYLVEIDVDESLDNCLVSGDKDKDVCDTVSDNLPTSQNSSDNGCDSKEEIDMCRDKRVHRPLIFSQISHLQSHIRIHTGEKTHQCPTCEKTFSKMSSLQVHIKTHTGEKPHKCHTCEKTFIQKSNLQSHIRTHTGEKTFKCNICENTFFTKGGLQNHIRTHTREKAHICHTCEKIFPNRSSLQYHIRIHTGEKPHKCHTCERAFSHKSNLQSHIRTHIREKPHQCLTCEKTFSQKRGLQLHIRTHTGEKEHKCHICEKTFSHKGNLQYHIRTHTEEKPHQCLTCEKTFSLKVYLQSHIKIHTGEKPHKCHTCGKTFSQKSNLQVHIRTHTTGEKTHKCLTCEKTFYKNCNLQYHMRTHTGEKPYKCLTCEKTFSHKSSLQYHIRTHTEEMPHQCLTCEKTFSHKSSLQYHMRTHTREKPHKCHTSSSSSNIPTDCEPSITVGVQDISNNIELFCFGCFCESNVL